MDGWSDFFRISCSLASESVLVRVQVPVEPLFYFLFQLKWSNMKSSVIITNNHESPSISLWWMAQVWFNSFKSFHFIHNWVPNMIYCVISKCLNGFVRVSLVQCMKWSGTVWFTWSQHNHMTQLTFIQWYGMEMTVWRIQCWITGEWIDVTSILLLCWLTCVQFARCDVLRPAASLILIVTHHFYVHWMR